MDIRRDDKGRVLYKGESQRLDGRYMYVYNDEYGNRKSFYSWTLDKEDTAPTGKRVKKSLREMEEEIGNCQLEGIVPYGGGCDVLTIVKRYIKLKRGVKRTTQTGYRTVVNLLEREKFAKRRIDTITVSDAKIWFIYLSETKGKRYSTIHTIRGVLRPAFQMAMDDDLIKKNPFNFELSSILKNDSETREALTAEEEKRFLEYVKNDPHYQKYYDGFYILLNTGLRISEFTGLTISDIDFVEKTINIDHQLMRITRVGYYVESTKTSCGTRKLPMSNEVANCFKRVLFRRPTPKQEIMIDGYGGFIFLDKNGNPEVANHWEKHFWWSVNHYNQTHKDKLPRITPHVCRHTYCSKMARSGMNSKVLQYLMGHADISVTLNVYTHMKYDDAIEEIRRLAIGD